jgi:AcrR family transcriptional regulator
MRNTKQNILDVSLDLFSQNGFSAVSIRDICGKVEIKESSVYYHFKNKQAILDAILQLFTDKADQMMGQLDAALGEQALTAKGDFYQKVCNTFFENYLMDPFCNKVMRLLLIEQFHNEDIQLLYDHWMFDRPLSFQSKAFSYLIEAGMIQTAECEYLATQYYAPIYLYAQRWLLTGTMSEERKNAFRRNAYGHIQQFFTEIGRAK